MSEFKYEDMKIEVQRDFASSHDDYIPKIAMIAQLAAEVRNTRRALAERSSHLEFAEQMLKEHGKSWKAVGMLIDEMFLTGLQDDGRILEYVWEEVKKIHEAAQHNFQETPE